MTRRLRWLALTLAICLSAVGALVAYVLAGSRWAAVGAVIGAVTGSFAPSVYDGLVNRGDRRQALQAAVERPVPRSYARLLDARLEIVRFVGRENELKALEAWCRNDYAGRLRLVTGPGGVGKTRLAIELADRMRKVGWRTERVADGKEANTISAMRDAHRGRALLVVDYAEARTGLNQMLSDLAGERGAGMRVLLLARSSRDWWDRLGIEDLAAWDLAQTARQSVIELSPVVSAELSNADVVAGAVRAFARELGLPEKVVDVNHSTEPRRVLDVHAAALVAVLDKASTYVASAEVGAVLGELLRHEQHFWYDSAQARGLTDGQSGVTHQQLRQVIAVACLLGAADDDDARALAARVPGLTPSAKLADWLCALYPPDPGQEVSIGTVQPDRLAELHAIREIKASPELARGCLTNLTPQQALRAMTILARASADYREAEDLLRQALPRVVDVIATMSASLDALTAISNAIPYPTVVLAPAAVSLCQRIISLLTADTDTALRASWLRSPGARLSALGRAADALPPTLEAAAMHRELAAVNPNQYRPDLAQSLHSLGIRLATIGHPEEALSAAQESVAIRRELAAANPDRYGPDLTFSLINLGFRLAALGRREEALPVTQEAVAIRRELAATDPDRYRPDFAFALTSLGARLAAIGRLEEALPVTRHPPRTCRSQPRPVRPRPRILAA